MRIITLGTIRYTVRDDRDDIMAAHAKCTGKHKLVKSKGAEKRLYPPYGTTMSTADYVAAYENLNKKIMPWDWRPLSENITLASGEDSAWEVANESDI